MNLENDADELAALGMIAAGIAVIVISVIAQLFFGATMDVGDIEKLGGLLTAAPALYLFGKGNPKKELKDENQD